ncbi:MAG: DUF5320 family protein [Thermoplasmatales archaeon]|nr:DUF5320 family protein [Thermoplasmatales archaeon]
MFGWYGIYRWPGRGPFSYLPPWQRPGWLFGRGACWWLFNPYFATPWLPTASFPTPTTSFAPTKEWEKEILKKEIELIEQELERIKNRLSEIESK